MLSLKNFLLVATISTGCVVHGAPTEKRAGPGVYVTTDANWAGSHLYIANVVKGQCYTFAASWQNAVSSFGPDEGLKCYGYQQANCQPPSPNYGPFYYPGISTHSAWDQDGFNYDNRVNSFKCWDGTPTSGSSSGTSLVTSTSSSTRQTGTSTSTRQSSTATSTRQSSTTTSTRVTLTQTSTTVRTPTSSVGTVSTTFSTRTPTPSSSTTFSRTPPPSSSTTSTRAPTPSSSVSTTFTNIPTSTVHTVTVITPTPQRPTVTWSSSSPVFTITGGAPTPPRLLGPPKASD